MGEAMPAKAPEQKAAYDARRKRSEQLLVQLASDEAQRVREAAASLGPSLSEFVLALAEGVRSRLSTSRRSRR